MNRDLSILLIEDDQSVCDEFANYIEELDGVMLVGQTNNMITGLKYVTDFLPDAIILDLELHQGFGNGLSFLQKLQTIEVSCSPYIIVTTNNISNTTYDIARKLGADFIMGKYQTDYSCQGVVDFLVLMKDSIMTKAQTETVNSNSSDSPARAAKKLTRKISIELDRVGISPKAVGYKYIVDAIQLVMNDTESNICSEIAATYKKTDSSVERAMQNAINRAWRTADIDELTTHYTAKINSNRGVPTLTEFIFFYANKIKNEL